jgi:hypothetical protein
MTREMIWKLDQLQDFFEYVKKAGLEDTVYAVLGGIPAKYGKLWSIAKTDLQKDEDAREIIGTHLCAQISAAIDLVEGFCGSDNDTVAKLMNLFQENKVFRESTLVANKLQRPTPDKVFRKVKQDGVLALIPASNAIGIVLRHGLTRETTLDELEELVKHKM